MTFTKFIQLYNPHYNLVLEHFCHSPHISSCPFASPDFCLSSLTTTDLIYISINDTIYVCIYVYIFVIFNLIYFYIFPYFCVYQNIFLLFLSTISKYGWLSFVYSLSSSCIFLLLLCFGYYEERCYEHLCMSLWTIFISHRPYVKCMFSFLTGY